MLTEPNSGLLPRVKADCETHTFERLGQKDFVNLLEKRTPATQIVLGDRSYIKILRANVSAPLIGIVAEDASLLSGNINKIPVYAAVLTYHDFIGYWSASTRSASAHSKLGVTMRKVLANSYKHTIVYTDTKEEALQLIRWQPEQR
jgi:hypothetical protein